LLLKKRQTGLSLRSPFVVLVILGLFISSCVGCNSGQSGRITYTKSCDGLVENGIVRETAVVPLGDAKAIVIPNDTTVLRTNENGLVTIEVVKELAFWGHPPERMTIDEEQHKASAAYCRSEDVLFLSRCGGWLLPDHGGFHCRLPCVHIPENVVAVRWSDIEHEEYERIRIRPLSAEELFVPSTKEEVDLEWYRAKVVK